MSNTTITNNTWHHIAIILRSATDMKIYVDGVNNGGVYSGTGGNLIYSNTPGSLGRRDHNLGVSANYFKGYLDEFRYWDRVINIEEIRFLCNEVLSENSLNPNDLKITLYPNPVVDYIHFDSEYNFEKIEIYNATGSLIQSSRFVEMLDVSHLEGGFYFLRISSRDVSVIEKITIN